MSQKSRGRPRVQFQDDNDENVDINSRGDGNTGTGGRNNQREIEVPSAKRKFEMTNSNLPITKSKVKVDETGFGILDQQVVMKMTTQSKRGHGDGKEVLWKPEPDPKVPKELQNIVTRQKVLPKRKSPKKSGAAPAPLKSPAECNADNKVTVKTVVARGIELKRVDSEIIQTIPNFPSGTVISRNPSTMFKPKAIDAKPSSGVMKKKPESQTSAGNSKLKRKTATLTPSSKLSMPPAPSKSQKTTQHKRPVGNLKSARNMQMQRDDAKDDLVTQKENFVVAAYKEVESYKTLQEFLDMPSVHDVNANGNPEERARSDVSKNSKRDGTDKDKPPGYYKSKFWDYVHPTKKETKPEKPKKPIDHDALKTYMVKRREQRREKEQKDLQAKSELLQKKKQQLQELQDKCRVLAHKHHSKDKPKVKSNDNHKVVERRELQTTIHNSISIGIDEEVAERKKDVVNEQVPEKPLSPDRKPMKVATTTKMSAATTRASLLLQEFEKIVKRECINFFQAKTIQTESWGSRTRPLRVPSAPKSLVDRSIETSKSGDASQSSESESPNMSTSTVVSVHYAIEDQAATKIQAAYRGYKERRVMEEAGMLPKNVSHMKKALQMDPLEKHFVISKVPAKSSDPVVIHQPRLSDRYIPPVPSVSQGSQSHKKLSKTVLPQPEFINLTAQSSKKRFDTCYPSEAIKRFEEAQLESPSRRGSFSDIRHGTAATPSLKKSVDFLISSGKSLPGTPRSSKSCAAIKKQESILPSITDALLAKLRLLNDSNNQRARPSSVVSEGDNEGSMISSITRDSKAHDPDAASQDVSITDDYFGPTDSEARHTRTSTPIPKKPDDQSDTPSLDSNTTVETDAEMVEQRRRLGGDNHNQSQRMGLEGATDTSGSMITGGYSMPIPILKLQYEAERERLNILEKALQTTVNFEMEKAAAAAAANSSKRKGHSTKSEIEAIARRVTEENVKLNLAELEKERLEKLLKQHEENAAHLIPLQQMQLEAIRCHQEAAKASAEVSKWALEMGKSLLEEKQRSLPPDVAGIICATIEETKLMIQRERQRKLEGRFLEVGPSHFVQIPSTTAIGSSSNSKEVGFQHPSQSDPDLSEAREDTPSETKIANQISQISDVADEGTSNKLSDESAKYSESFISDFEKSIESDKDEVEKPSVQPEVVLDETSEIIESETEQVPEFDGHPSTPSPVVTEPLVKTETITESKTTSHPEESVELACSEENSFVESDHKRSLTPVVSDVEKSQNDEVQQDADNNNSIEIVEQAVGLIQDLQEKSDTSFENEVSSQWPRTMISPVPALKDDRDVNEIGTIPKSSDSAVHDEENKEEQIEIVESIALQLDAVIAEADEQTSRISDASEKYSESFLSDEDKEKHQEPMLDDDNNFIEPQEETKEQSQSPVKEIQLDSEVQCQKETPSDLEKRQPHEQQGELGTPDAVTETLKEQNDKETTENDDEDRKEKLLELAQEQQRVEKEIREIEAEISKPHAFDSILIALQSKDPSIGSSEVQTIVAAEVDKMWESWTTHGHLPMNESTERVADTVLRRNNSNVQEFDLETCKAGLDAETQDALTDLVRGYIVEALQIKQLKTDEGFADTFRKGGKLALEVAERKVPQTQNALVTAVIERTTKCAPVNKGGAGLEPPSASGKWSCRPRDMAEELLTQEVAGEEHTYVRTVLDDAISAEETADFVLRTCINDVLNNFDIAFDKR